MRARVLTDPALAEHAGRFAWLSVDVEQTANAAFLETYPWEAVPSFLVIDPRSERVVYEWLGNSDLPELVRRFGEAERAVRGSSAGDAAAALAEADRLYAEDRKVEAAAAYRRAIVAGGPGWSERERAVESMVVGLAISVFRAPDHAQACAQGAMAEAPTLPRGAAFANVVSCGLWCAVVAPENEPWRPLALETLEPLVVEAVGLPGLLADDRSMLYETLVEAREAAGDDDGKKRVAQQWFDFLDRATLDATSAEERAAFDAHRVSAARALGDPARALPALEASVRDLPGDYNPLADLAVVLGELGRYDEALGANERALALAYGPRKIRLYESRATIFEKMGEPARAREALADALSYAKSLPASPRLVRAIERLEKSL